jgi:diguanylate cyclase (GGDEF)-like protein/PAS domain S-box-containing protein
VFIPAAYHLNALSALNLATAVVITYLGVFVVVRDRYSPVSRAFFVMTLTGSVWLFCFAFLYGSPDETVGLRWAKVAYLGLALNPAALYHFTTLVLLTYERDKHRVAVFWIISAVFFVSVQSTDFLFHDLYRYSWGFYPKYGKTSVVFVLYFLVMTAVVLHRYAAESRSAPPGSMRCLRARSLLRFFVFSYIACLDFFVAYGIPLYPVGSVFILISTVFVSNAVWRYRFIDVTPAFAAKTIVDTMSDALLIVDPEGVIRHSNRAAARLFGMTQQQLEGKDVATVLPTHIAGALKELFQANDAPASETARYESPQGQRTLSVSASAVRNRTGHPIAVVYTVQDITERKKAEEQIKYLAYYDSLTGLPNRTFYREILSRAVIYAKRHKLTMATLFIDLDSFKCINDTLGHSSGDELLKIVAQRLTKCVRKTDYVARLEEERMPDTVSRFGGDEFIVLLSEIREGEDAARVAIRILDVLSKPFLISGREVFISASIGISLFPADGEDAEELLKNADVAMYAAKGQGKNLYLFYTSSMNAASQQRLRLESELRKAIDCNEFIVEYQPRYDIRSNTVVCVEALVRWNHAERGIMLPEDFIPLAEETGMIIPLGEIILRTACKEAVIWMSEIQSAVAVAVSLSARQCEERFKEIINVIVAETGLPPGFLELEITESTIMHDPQKAITMLQEWQARGIRVSIDNFGTGYSSLNQLSRLPVKALKIDRSFVMNILEDAAIVKAVVAMAHHLGLRVIAEGVETKEQLALLHSLGCDEAQGSYFCRPLSGGEIQTVLIENNSFSCQSRN